MGRIFTSCFWRATMSVVLALSTAVTVWADEVYYYDPTAEEGSQMKTVNATAVTGETTALSSGWYVVSGEVTFHERIQVEGEVNLILADGCHWFSFLGIHVPKSSTFNLYAQSSGESKGHLELWTGVGNASIGGDAGEDCTGAGCVGGNGEDAGTISIYGGTIYVNDTMGGGNGGSGNTAGSHGSGKIYLSHDYSENDIYAGKYNGEVTLLKDFINIYDPSQVFPAGVANSEEISNRHLGGTIIYHAPCKPTCTTDGYLKPCWFNIVTGEYYDDKDCTVQVDVYDVKVPVLGHMMSHTELKAATFTTPGNIEYWHCSQCGQYFSDEFGYSEVEQEDLTFSVQGNASDGYYVLMPKQNTVMLSVDSNISSFKIYDDGGEGDGTGNNEQGNYSDNCHGALVLVAPMGKVIQLKGEVLTEQAGGSAEHEEVYDYMNVYRGATTDGELLLEKMHSSKVWMEDDMVDGGGDYVPVSTPIVPISVNTMTILFHSDTGGNLAGLNLTATVADAQDYTITIASAQGGTVTMPASAYCGDEVTMTIQPESGYILESIKATYKDTHENTVEMNMDNTGWYSTSCTFIMPDADVTITPTFTTNTENLFVIMPKTGTITVDIPAGITSFKIYDDGGEGGSNTETDAPGNYSNGCNGFLVLKAPEGQVIQFTGRIMTESGFDFMKFYHGTTVSDEGFIKRYTGDNGESYPFFNEELIGNSLTLEFSSDSDANREGIDLTATISSEEATGIQTLPANGNNGTEQWHDLSGRRIERLTQPGVYIHNGKKVVVK